MLSSNNRVIEKMHLSSTPYTSFINHDKFDNKRKIDNKWCKALVKLLSVSKYSSFMNK